MIDAIFVRRVELAPDIWRAVFQPGQALRYDAGQYLDVRLNGVQGDARGQGRTFTLTSLPSEPEVSFVYRFDTPTSPYKQSLQRLVPGDTVQLGEVMGDLVLPKLATVPLVFVAGGIGMASFEGMLRELIHSGEHREIHLFYSLRNVSDDAFKQLVADFPFESKQYFVKPDYVSANHIANAITPDSLVYLSGSERFVLGLRDNLHKLGYGDNQVIFDFYDGYTEL